MVAAIGCSEGSDGQNNPNPNPNPNPDPQPTGCPANELWYTTESGELITLEDPTCFGTEIVDHTYEEGKGVIRFASDLHTIGSGAFYFNDDLKQVTLGSAVERIEEMAFASCMGMEEILLPESLSEIGGSAFSDCTNLKEITIPEGVERVGMRILFNCSSLTAIKSSFSTEDQRAMIVEGELLAFAPAGLSSYTLPEEAESVAPYTFYGASELTTITTSDQTATLGEAAFAGCSNLAMVTLGAGTTSIGSVAFADCEVLKEIYCNALTPPALGYQSFGYEVPSELKIYVPNEAVEAYKSAEGWSEVASLINPAEPVEPNPENCKIYYTTTDGKPIYDRYTYGVKLVSNTYENGVGVMIFDGEVESIRDNFMYAKKTLKTIDLPASVKSIYYDAFIACSSLERVTLREGVTSIGDRAFSGCAIKEFTIPNSVTRVGSEAFKCKSLEKLYVGRNVAYFGNNAFGGCENLKHVYITDLKAWCNISFSGYAPSQTSAVNPLSYEATLYLNGEPVRELVIPEEITTLQSGTFFGCSSLERVTIHEGVTDMGYQIFNGCLNLKEVYCRPTTPPTPHCMEWWNSMGATYYYWLTFNSIPEVDGRIYVPEESVEAYKSAFMWDEYAPYIVGYDF